MSLGVAFPPGGEARLRFAPGAVQSLPSPPDSPFSFPRSTRRSWRTWRTSSISPTSATPSGCTAGARRIPTMTPRWWGSSRCDSPFHTRSSVWGGSSSSAGERGKLLFLTHSEQPLACFQEKDLFSLAAFSEFPFLPTTSFPPTVPRHRFLPL